MPTSRRTPALLFLGTAVVQAASVPLAGFDQGAGNDPTVVPPGPFFATWGVVVIGCLVSAAVGLPAHRADSFPWRAVQVPLAAVQVLFALWLLTAATARFLTLPIFIAMLALLIPALRNVVNDDSERTTRYVLGGTLGVYAGWSSAAVWINALTLLPETTLSSRAGQFLQVAAVIAATVTVCAATIATRAWPPYVLAGAWALIGVLSSAVDAGDRSLWTTAAAALLATGATVAVAIRRVLRSSAHPDPSLRTPA